jgi:hypothetical protein
MELWWDAKGGRPSSKEAKVAQSAAKPDFRHHRHHHSKKPAFGPLCLVCRGAALLPLVYYAVCMPWRANLVPAGQHLLSASKHCLLVLIVCAAMV